MTKSKPWTHDEMSLKAHGYFDLASAVCRQWKTDGMPIGDKDGIKLWAQVIETWRYHGRYHGRHHEVSCNSYH